MLNTIPLLFVTAAAMPTPEATPLLTDLQRLPLQTEPTQAHDSAPISARVSHSAFGLPRQQALVIIRGGILAYLTGLGPVVVRSKLTESAAVRETPWSIIFDFTTASLILQWLWYFVTFVSLGLLKSPCSFCD